MKYIIEFKPHDEFLKLQEDLLNYEDLRCLREAKEAEKNAPTVGIDELRKRIGGRPKRSTGPSKARAER
jgi:hypothetical protein